MSRWLGSEAGQAKLARLRDNDPELLGLVLNDNDVGDDGATAIAEGLKTNSALQSLDLNRNNVGDAGKAALLAVLEGHPSLKSIYGIGWAGSEAGQAELARLRDNDPELVRLYLSWKGVGDDGATAIAEGL